MSRAPLALSVALAAWIVASPDAARADTDYDPASDSWNGLSQLVQAARDMGVRVDTPARLDVGTLRATDALLIVYPTGPLPVEGLSGFLKAGGRIGLADDFGTGASLLSAYQITRRAPDAAASLRLRGNDALLVARPSSAHPLTEGVGALVTNHPQQVFHRELDPLFSFDRTGSALVLAGAVGRGRLVAVADPSTLINNMLQFRGNRRFAANLVRYLAHGPDGRIVLVTGATPIVGRFGEPGADRPLHDLRSALEKLARATLPPAAVQLSAVVLSAILLLVAATALPRHTPYDGRGMFARAPHSGGLVGRIDFFRDGKSDFLQPTMVYKFELEGEIVRRMGLSTKTNLRDVLAALRARGVPEATLTTTRALLIELDALHQRQDRPPNPPRVTAARFGDMVRRGEALLARLDDRTVHAR
jgi:hypothetical protein